MNKVQPTTHCSKSKRNKSADSGKPSFSKLLQTFFLLLFFVSTNIVFSQTPQIDSLKKALNNPHNDQLAILLGLCKNNPSMNADTALMYATRARYISEQRRDFENKMMAEFYIASRSEE